MRLLKFFTFALFLCSVCAPLHAAVDVVVETKVFHRPGGNSLVEVNMAFLAGTMVSAADASGSSVTQVESLTLIEKDGKIEAYGKTVISGSPRRDSVQVDMLHQEFFDLPPGNYVLSLEVRDLNNSDTTVTRYSSPLVVSVLDAAISISDILVAERFDKAKEGSSSKFGYNAVPLLTDYFPKEISRLNFYAEIYGTDIILGNDSSYVINYQVESFETRQVYGQLKVVSRAKAKAVEPVFAEFDITTLPSGNYLTAIEVFNRAGVLLARKEQFIQRNNKITLQYDLQALEELNMENTFVGSYTDTDTLAEQIASLRPIADALERKIIDDRWKDRDLGLMQRFFYTFWANRSNDPENAWFTYRAEVLKVNRIYGCRNMRGYQTDRGYVYLKYGPPNTQMDRMQELDAFPYTIWHYYRAGRYSNKRFIFYQPDLVTNCMVLLHSEVPGELKNPRWNQILHERNVASPNVDPFNVGTQSGDRATEFYNMPR